MRREEVRVVRAGGVPFLGVRLKLEVSKKKVRSTLRREEVRVVRAGGVPFLPRLGLGVPTVDHGAVAAAVLEILGERL